MEIINKQVVGDLTVTQNAQYNNLLCDNIVVEENITARIFGIVKKDLVLKTGSTVYLHGRIHGKVSNQGGVLYVFLPDGRVESY